MHKIFGKEENVHYYFRKGAYIIPIQDGKIAVVKLPKGLFLIGGGVEKGETDLQCLKRECLEETGFKVEIGEKLCSAEAFSNHSHLGPFHPYQTYYLGKMVEKVKKPIEKDHNLCWIAFEELKGKLFSDMQNWAVEEAIESFFKSINQN